MNQTNIQNFKIIIFPFLVLLFVTSCTPESKFTTATNGLQFFFETRNDGIKPKVQDVIELEMKILAPNKTVLFSSKSVSKSFKMKLNEPSHEGGSFEDALSMMNIGEKASFLIDAEKFYKHTRKQELPAILKKGDLVEFEIKLIKVVTQAELDAELKQVEKEKFKNEQKALNEFLTKQNISGSPTKSGLYIRTLKKGKGKKPVKGNVVYVHYTGKLIDGNPFDSSIDRGVPFKFEVGAGKVISAWEEAILTMEIGEKVLVISPSNLAYGNAGYGKIIPPFSTLVFEIKLLSIE